MFVSIIRLCIDWDIGLFSTSASGDEHAPPTSPKASPAIARTQ